MRGNRGGVSVREAIKRSIPACAGEPEAGRCRLRRSRVYPRVCGGTSPGRPTPSLSQGLSPRVRGNPNQPSDSAGDLRSIPACAGEPPRKLPFCGLCKVYPRVCGGTTPIPPTPHTSYGLSPRVRGNPLRRENRRDRPGSIPACAGEPLEVRANPHPPTVYPRVCGGTLPRHGIINEVWGLSPRVRGNLSRRQSVEWRLRSIPACAGEPTGGGGLELLDKVYPRVCGGTSGRTLRRPGCGGLSPRVRGNPGIPVGIGG